METDMERDGTDIKQSIESKRIESNRFDFENLCLFCCKACDRRIESKRNKKRVILSLTVKNANQVLMKLKNIDNPEVNKVKKLIEDAPKGKGQGSKYHQDCQQKFVGSCLKKKIGRPSEIHANLDGLFEFMRDSVEEQFLFYELVEKVGCSCNNNKALTEALKYEFGEEIIITKLSHKAPRLATFKKAQANIFNEYYELSKLTEK